MSDPAIERRSNAIHTTLHGKAWHLTRTADEKGGKMNQSRPPIDSSGHSRRWQGKTWAQVLAAVLGALPVYAILLILQYLSGQEITIQGFTLYLAVIAPLGIVIVWLLLRFLCGEKPRDLNLKPGKPSTDLLATLGFSVVVIVLSVVSTFLLSMLLPESSNTSVENLFAKLAGNPGMLALFAGPLFLVGAASEEVIRVFFLSRLWKAWPSLPARWVAIVISAGLFGLVHYYQGPVNAAWTAIFGLIAAVYYLRFGRAVPLILAHWLTNALQGILFALLAQ
jgi:membrane protease YdiL (CAAX protease family)